MEGGVRLASDEQKAYLFVKQAGLCAACNKQLSVSDPADHIILYAIGGETCLSNLQLLCATCHAVKTKADLRLARASRD